MRIFIILVACGFFASGFADFTDVIFVPQSAPERLTWNIKPPAFPPGAVLVFAFEQINTDSQGSFLNFSAPNNNSDQPFTIFK
jgi:hypothetical protein